MRMQGDINILVVDDEEDFRDLFSEIIQGLGYQPLTAKDGVDALEVLKKTEIDIAIVDLQMPRMNGIELLREIKKQDPNIEVLLITGFGTISSAVEAMKLGAYDYITKPVKLEEVENLIRRIVQTRTLISENRMLRQQLKKKYKFQNLIGATPQMQEIFKIIARVSQNNCTVLIQGESGTGKELIARAIHFNGPNADKPFIPIDCGSINENLVESELFGHERGAFTGAYTSKKGLFRVAHGGTVFLDEIGDIPKDVQAKLLRALQERKIKPVGGTKFIDIDVRVIAATNRNLDEAITDGQFRKDLFYRLNVVQINVPPLRERKDDIPLLVNHFIKNFNKPGRAIKGISKEALEVLMNYDWPGNVRELENVIERAFALGTSDLITIDDLPSALVMKSRKTPLWEDELKPLAEIEKEAILKTLEKTGGDKQAAARILKIDRSTLYRKLHRYGAL